MHHYWLVKQEPSAYSWSQLIKEGMTAWTGVRNFQARNFLKEMKKDDLVLFYHSVNEKQVVGLARVKKEFYPDPTIDDKSWVAVDLEPVKTLKTPVSLKLIKQDPSLKDIPLIRQSRLSVMPLKAVEFHRILELGKTLA